MIFIMVDRLAALWTAASYHNSIHTHTHRHTDSIIIRARTQKKNIIQERRRIKLKIRVAS